MTHTLDFSLDHDLVKEYRDVGLPYDDKDPDVWVIFIACHDKRPTEEQMCRYWIECGHTPPSTECTASPSGKHEFYNGVGRYWTKYCYAEQCDESGDAAIDLIQRHNLPFGSYSIIVDDAGENYISFALSDSS